MNNMRHDKVSEYAHAGDQLYYVWIPLKSFAHKHDVNSVFAKSAYKYFAQISKLDFVGTFELCFYPSFAVSKSRASSKSVISAILD